MEIPARSFAGTAVALLLLLSALSGTVSALGMLNLDFGAVEQGKAYIRTVTVVTSPQDFENQFVIEPSGELAPWLAVSPPEFELRPGDSQVLTVTLTVPESADLGEYTGTITAVGQQSAPAQGETGGGAAVGYTVAGKSKVRATVIKPGAVEAVSILEIRAPTHIDQGSVAKFAVMLKNTGNVPASASPLLTVQKGSDTVATVPGVAIELGVGEEKTANLYWDAEDTGSYTALVTVTCGGVASTSDPVGFDVAEAGFSIPGLQAPATVAALLALLGWRLLRRKR